MKILTVYRHNFAGIEIVWQAPFKDMATLLKAIEDYSSSGFFCKVN